jgi:hypothetical protein
MEVTTISPSNSDASQPQTPPNQEQPVLTPQAKETDTVEVIKEEVVKSELDLLIEKIKPSSHGKKRTYSTIDISADKWFLTLDSKALVKLDEPPSIADGLDLQTERVGSFRIL